MKFGCVVHHQGIQSAEQFELDGIRSSSSVSWANSKPTSGQVGVISIERESGLDLLMTAPVEAMDQPTAELLADKLADTIRLFSNFPNCSLTALAQNAEADSPAESKTPYLDLSQSLATRN
jgi:hypothetical protein